MRDLERALAIVGIVALFLLGGLVLWAGLGSVLTMDAGSSSQGGQYYVGAVVIGALLWVVSQAFKFWKRL